MSHVYRTKSLSFPIEDGNNQWLSRFPMRRLEAEAIRDAILAVSGSLDRTHGGPTIDVPHNLAGSGSDSGNNYPENGPIDGNSRRSIYLAARRNFPSTFLEVFDRPNSQQTFGRRDTSNVPTQALTLLNDPFVSGQSRIWAASIMNTPNETASRIEAMFLRALARKPEIDENSVCEELVRSADSEFQGWTDVATAIFNSKEFIYVP